jgi:hypothetical protein
MTGKVFATDAVQGYMEVLRISLDELVGALTANPPVEGRDQ